MKDGVFPKYVFFHLCDRAVLPKLLTATEVAQVEGIPFNRVDAAVASIKIM